MNSLLPGSEPDGSAKDCLSDRNGRVSFLPWVVLAGKQVCLR